MGMSAGGDDQGMMAEINVTPFVDVMLVLLIIFMVTTPIIVAENTLNKIDVAVPPADAEPLTEVAEDQLVLSIDVDGKTWIAQTEVTLTELEEKLSALMDAKPDKQVFLNADGDVPYSRVAEVMALCSRAGVEDLGMITETVED